MKQYAKWSAIPVYAIVAFIVWYQRCALFNLLSVEVRKTWLGDWFPSFIILSLLIIGLAALIVFIRAPFPLKRKVNRAFERVGLHNQQGEYPKLFSVRADSNKEHGKIITVINRGVSIVDFDANVPRLEANLDGHIYAMEYAGRHTTKTNIYLLPQKFIKPTIIDTGSTWLCHEPNCLIVGQTGSGKSYLMLTMLGCYTSFYSDNLSIVVCDYKKSSFAQFDGTQNFYAYQDVPNGIKEVYCEFSERLAANDSNRNSHIVVLMIDELGAMLSAQERKISEELKTYLSNMLFMGRSLGIVVICGTQRGDSEYFKNGGRDQFRQIIGLGNLSKEQKQMLFSAYKDQMTANCGGVGDGYYLREGKNVERIHVAAIDDIKQLNAKIKRAMNCPLAEQIGAEAEREAPAAPPAEGASPTSNRAV